MQVQSLGQEDTLEKETATVFRYSCLGNPKNSRAWRATVSPWGSKRVRHDLVTKQQEHKLE